MHSIELQKNIQRCRSCKWFSQPQGLSFTSAVCPLNQHLSLWPPVRGVIVGVVIH